MQKIIGHFGQVLSIPCLQLTLRCHTSIRLGLYSCASFLVINAFHGKPEDVVASQVDYHEPSRVPLHKKCVVQHCDNDF